MRMMVNSFSNAFYWAKSHPVTSQITVAVPATVIAGWIVAGWSSIMAFVAPDIVTGRFIMLIPGETISSPQKEFVTLKSHKGQAWGTKQQAEDEQAKSEPKSWDYSGYFKEGHLILSYRSTQDYRIGFGVYFLKLVNAQGTEYRGQWEGNDCPGDGDPRILRCPAILVQVDKNATPEFLREFTPSESQSKYLRSSESCVVVEILQRLEKNEYQQSCASARTNK
jgi:hypothetical protein